MSESTSDFYGTDENLVCKGCGVTLPYQSTSEELVPLCPECRANYLKLKIPKWLIAALVILTIAVVYKCITDFPSGIKSMRISLEADSAYSDKHYEVAINKYLEIEESKGLYTDDYCRLFISYVRTYDYETAEDIYNESLVGAEVDDDLYDAVNAAWDEIDDYYDISDEFYQVLLDTQYDDLEDTITAVQAYLVLDPDEYYAHSYLSDLYFQAEDYEASIDETLEVIRIKPSLTSMYLISLAGTYRQMGEFDQSYEAIDEALTYNKDDIYALCAYARTLIKEKKYEESLTYLQAIDPILTSYPTYKETLAMSYHYNGMTEERDALVTELEEVDQYDTTFIMEVINDQSVLYD